MATSEPSPVSDESSSEGPHLHEIVNEPIAHDQPTAMSPRSALLAHTSLIEHSAAEPVNTIIEPSRTRRRNSPSERRRKRERDLANASPSQRELVRLLIDQEQEASTLRKQLYIANQRVDSEARRAAELERANQQVTQRYREINESRVIVQQEASKAIQDSRLYHLELENAQKEIERARESLKQIERERDEAEAAAARARAKTRKLREQQMVAAAREEGRRLGFEAGFEHARQERLLIASNRPHSTATRRTPHSSSRDVITKPRSSADNASHQRSSNPQEEDEAALRRSRLLDDLDTSSEMSVSHLPIRNFPAINPSMNSPAISANLSSTSPLRPFQPPPESTYESGPHTPSPPPTSPPPVSAQESPAQMANTTPLIQIYPVEIPPQELLTREEIMREFNTKENPNDIIKQMPREWWVTAAKHRELKGSPPAPYPGPQPPPLLPQPKNVRLIKPPPKTVRFPSLAKTKQQATSWYRRSFSFRKKNKPVIDPDDEVVTSVQPQETIAPTSSTGNKGKAPELNPTSTQSSDSDVRYSVPPQPPQSWYKKSAASSIRTTDTKRRPISGVESSPGLSQFELLFTPHVGALSVRSGKEGKKVKEKDSQLSVIKEETPTSDRFLADAMRASSSRMTLSTTIPHSNFTGMQQSSSYAAIDSSLSPTKRRQPLAIVVPDPYEPLPSAGVAYSQPSPSNLQPQGHSLSHVAHKTSPSSARTTNDTPIGTEIVPPSGSAPDSVHSPPHTGQNHLSPYHVYHPTLSSSSSRILPMPSVTSFRGSGDKHLEPPQPLSIESQSGPRASSRRTDNRGVGSPRPQSSASRPPSAMGATPNRNIKSVDGAQSSHSPTPRLRTSMTMPPQTSPRPESARSSASKKQPFGMNSSTSQTNLVVGQQQQPQQPSSSTLNLVLPIRHSTSRVSLREAGSFANGFDDGTYLDPAFYPGDGPMARDGNRSQTSIKQRLQQPSNSFLNSPGRHSTSRVSLREARSFSNGFDDGKYLDPAFYPGDRPPDGHRSQAALNVPTRPVSGGDTSSALSYV